MKVSKSMGGFVKVFVLEEYIDESAASHQVMDFKL
jgi:hypothetical protein